MSTSQIISFDSLDALAVPDYLRSTTADNADLTSHSQTSFASLSIKGKNFAVIRGKDRTPLMNPKDPDAPATYVEVVVVKASSSRSKVYYAEAFKDDGIEGKKPDCASADGVKPDEGIANPQSTNCASCRHNQWGSRITEASKKGKACQDTVRAVVAPPGSLDDLMLLRIPPASFKNLSEFGKACEKRGIKYNGLVTRLGFEQDQAAPVLTFKPVGVVDAATFARVKEIADGEAVKSIIYAQLALKIGEVQPTTASAPSVGKTLEEALKDVEIELPKEVKEVKEVKQPAVVEVEAKEVKSVEKKADDLDIGSLSFSFDD